MTKGKFIVLEGIDGAGKSTVAQGLHRRLSQEVQKVIHIGTSTNTDRHSVVSDFIQDSILSGVNSFNPETQGLIFCAMINDLIDTFIIPNIEEGHTVVSERFTLSTRIYQANTPVTTVAINALETKIQPDLTIILDIPPEVHKNRSISCNKNDFMEAVDNSVIAERRRRYRAHARSRKDTYVLDGTQPVEAIIDSIIKLLG